MTEGARLFAALINETGKGQAELNREVEEKQSAAETKARGLVQDLEQEIAELRRKKTELEQLSHTEDHLLLLRVSTPPPAPPTPGQYPPRVSFVEERR